MRFENYVNEANRRKIYFAHPRAFYDKPEEKKAIAMIMKEFPEHIIVNPNVDWIQGRVDDMGFDIFFKVINTVEFVVAMPFPDGKMGNGTWREIEYADKKGKDIYVVRPQKNTLEKTAKNKIKWLTPEETYERIPKKEQHMWKMYESRVYEARSDKDMMKDMATAWSEKLGIKSDAIHRYFDIMKLDFMGANAEMADAHKRNKVSQLSRKVLNTKGVL